MPRFETTRNWAHQLAVFVPEGQDLAGDVARDTLTARTLLDQAGLSAQRDVLATPLQVCHAALPRKTRQRTAYAFNDPGERSRGLSEVESNSVAHAAH